jgi:hypothetical protein
VRGFGVRGKGASVKLFWNFCETLEELWRKFGGTLEELFWNFCGTLAKRKRNSGGSLAEVWMGAAEEYTRRGGPSEKE